MVKWLVLYTRYMVNNGRQPGYYHCESPGRITVQCLQGFSTIKSRFGKATYPTYLAELYLADLAQLG